MYDEIKKKDFVLLTLKVSRKLVIVSDQKLKLYKRRIKKNVENKRPYAYGEDAL